MTYIEIDGKWHVYVQDGAGIDSTACGITEWEYNPAWQTGEPDKLCAKCKKATKDDAG